MQRGAADTGAGQGYWLEFRDRRHLAGAPNLGYQPQQPAWRLLSGVLQGDGPARCFLCESRQLLLLQRVKLHDHAIRGVRQLVTLLLPALVKVDHPFCPAGVLTVRIDAKARGFQPLQ